MKSRRCWFLAWLAIIWLFKTTEQNGSKIIKRLVHTPEDFLDWATLPDESIATISKYDRFIRIWDKNMQTVLKKFKYSQIDSEVLRKIAVLHNGNIVGCLTKSDYTHTLMIWDPKTSYLIKDNRPVNYNSHVLDLEVLSDDLLAILFDINIVLWNLKTNEIVRTLETQYSTLSIQLLSTQDILMSSSWDGIIRFWDIETGQLLGIINNDDINQSVDKAIELSSGEIAGAYTYTFNQKGGVIKIWDPVTGALKRKLDYSLSSVSDLALLPNSYLVSSDSFGVHMWNETSGSLIKTLTDDAGAKLKAIPNGSLAIYHDSFARICDPSTGKCSKVDALDMREYTQFENLIVGDNQSLLSTISGVFHKLKSSDLSFVKRFDNDYIFHLVNWKNGFYLGTDGNGNITLWDKTDNVRHRIRGHYGRINTFAVFANGYLASASTDNTIKIWSINIANYSIMYERTLSGHASAITSLSALDNGNLVSASYDRTIRVWNPANGKLLKSFTDFLYPIKLAAPLNNSHIAIVYNAPVSVSKHIEILDLNEGESHKIASSSHLGAVTLLKPLEKGYLVSGSTDRTIKIWDTKNNNLVSTLVGHTESIDLAANMTDENGNIFMFTSAGRELFKWQLDLTSGCKFDGTLTSDNLHCRFKATYDSSHIDLSNSNIKSISPDTFDKFKRLSQLRMRHNQIRTLSVETFLKVPNLNLLDLGDNRIFELDSKLFQNQAGLQKLYLGANSLTTIPDAFFTNLRQLTELDLQQNAIINMNMSVLNNLCLKYLNLQENPIEESIETRFNGKCWEVHEKKTTLQLSQNYLLANGYSDTNGTQIIEINSKNLNSIDLDAFDGYKNLLMLNLGSNSIESLLFNQFNQLPALEELTLSNNKLSSIPKNMFSNLKRLTTVKLNSNLLTKIESDSFKGLENSVQRIDLRDNLITEIALDSFKKLNHLKRIYLRNNPFVSQADTATIHSLCDLPCIVLI